MSEKTIGIVGIGLMGGAIARNILRKGYDVIVFDKLQEKKEAFLSFGARLASSVGELSDYSDVIITSLPTPQNVKEVYFEKGGIIENIREGQVIIDTSTIDPGTSESVEAAVKKKKAGMLAVCLGKGPKQADEGSMPLYVGGEKAIYEKVEKLLAEIGGNVYYFGSVRAATGFKLISNMVGMGNLALIAEAYALSKLLSIPANVFLEALKNSGAASYQLELRLPMMIEGDYSTKFAVNYTKKDVGLGLEMAKQAEAMVPISSVISRLYVAAQEKGWGNLDSAAVYRIYEQSNFE
ncbi:NAD(P)-dependent oxidoreductase [bacterium]|nr:MAG: NAD(P)-dependent oxidoreductase [bacterium]